MKFRVRVKMHSGQAHSTIDIPGRRPIDLVLPAGTIHSVAPHSLARKAYVSMLKESISRPVSASPGRETEQIVVERIKR
jgi:hypothetical protein